MRSARYILSGIVAITGLIFLGKLLSIQVIDSDYRLAAQNNVMKRIREYPYRGELHDRGGRQLVYNKPTYGLMLTPKDLVIADTALFCKQFQIEKTVLNERLNAAKRYSYLKPSVLIANIDDVHFASIQRHLRNYSGLQVSLKMQRDYVHNSLAHVLGYMGEITQENLTQDTTDYYEMGDFTGITGIERSYETVLRGQLGARIQTVNAQGREIGSFEQGRHDQPSVAGQNIRLSIDLELQQYAEQLMQGKQGSIVAIEPSTGEVLAFVSAPTYLPKALSGEQMVENYQALVQDKSKPLFNRPLMAKYRPGSIFKIAQALVALETNVIDSTTYFSCDQSIINCHTHGAGTQLKGAITHSCNPYFYRVMRRMVQPHNNKPYTSSQEGLRRWRSYIMPLGFGSPLGIDLPYEQSGLVPDVSYYDRMYGTLRWKFSNIYSLAIGEGENLVVPLQMANFACVLANKGHYFTPHFVRNIPEQAELAAKYTQPVHTGIKPKHFDIVQDAMRTVVQYGTGTRANIPGIDVCGKTGSVQNYGRAEHSVFIGFAPQKNPVITVSIYVEYGGEGGTIAASIAGLVMEKYIKGDEAISTLEPYVMQNTPFYAGSQTQ